MKIDLVPSVDFIKEDKLIGKSVVVIDMLRATSVIVTAIKNKCKEVIPVVTIEEALALKDKNDCLLGGERHAVKIEGFDFSNSPLEYTEDKVAGKIVTMTTSNGTRAIKGCENGKTLIMAAMINGEAVAKKLVDIGDDVVIVNAGTEGEFSIDDFICGGHIINHLCNMEKETELTDIAKTALFVYKNNENVEDYIKEARHYRRIMELGLQDDFIYCCKKDITDVVPVYKEGKIVNRG